MSLPKAASQEIEKYEVSICQGTFAQSHAEALDTFLQQLVDGNVFVTVHNTTQNQTEELDGLSDFEGYDPEEIGIALIKKSVSHMTGHERVAFYEKVQKAFC